MSQRGLFVVLGKDEMCMKRLEKIVCTTSNSCYGVWVSSKSKCWSRETPQSRYGLSSYIYIYNSISIIMKI